ncbi:hypothetical protein [Lactobacillus plantarum] [Lactiplantibacillus mudanjiangensis]|uniref:MucBP domain-containing protein n=1 Tax=Lactiplantibacillus mudanjiangensis TaxID=1296538 RepID=UPI00101495E5|nr:MucBP domain-containing protein [Lactiplantibacillus mudanjiangensis]VDG31624.1 hypothetical protein [Lactobacillus plantarum] [Lactiplantibacillus mudanjiangensis]
MNKLPTEQVSLHYKMYKKGRFWVFAGMTMFGASLGLSLLPNQTVSAATAATDSTVVAKQATTDSSQPAADKQAGNDKDQNATTDQTTTTSDAVQTPAATTPAKTDGTTDATDQSTNQDKQQSAIKPASADINDDDADSTDDSGTTDTNDDSTTTNDDNSDDTTNTNDESTGKTNTNTDTKANQDTTTGTGVGDYDNAKPITDNPKAVVPKTDDKLSGKYAFIPKFNGSGTTTASVIGTEMSTDKPNTIATDLVTATKGQVGFKYTNVGYDADGNGMDMNILFTDWGRLSDISDAYVETYTNMIYTNFPGAGWVDVKYQFVRSDTGKEEAVSGIMTLTDIDGAQTVAISGDQWNKLDTAYVPTSEDPTTGQVDNWLRYSNKNDYTIISSPKVNSDASDEYAMLTFTYSNQGSLTFRYSNGKDTPTKMTVWGVNYVPQKPLATAVIAPTATTTDSDQTNVKQNSLKDGETTYQYNFKQTIPDEWEQFYYKNVTFTGNLPTNVTLKNIKVTNETGQDVTQYFTNQSSGSNLKLTVNADYLGNADFYGHYYTITAQVNADQTDSVQTLKMSILTTIDGDSQASNTVTTTADQKHYVTTHYYIQGTTTKLAADTKTRVIAGSKYQTKAQQVTGYTLAKQTNTSGTMTTGNIEAMYDYAPIIIDIPVTYVDQNGKQIAPSATLTGQYGTGYDATNSQLTLTGYNLVNSDNPTGVYSFINSPVVFHYQAKQITLRVKDIDNYKNNLDDELGLGKYRTITGYYNDSFQIKPLDLPQWTEIYSGSSSVLQGNFPLDDTTITLHYKQPWNQNYDNYDGSHTIPVFNGLDKLIGVMQVHPDVNEDMTVVQVKPDGQYLVGTMDDDIDISTFHQQATVGKGQSVTITTNTGEKVRVSISKAGAITIAHLNSNKVPVADRATISADGETIKQYIDTNTAVKGLSTSVYALDGEYSYRKATQTWPNGYTTVYDDTDPDNVIIKVMNAKGKVVYSKQNFKLTKAATIKIGQSKWTFTGTKYGALTSEEVVVNKLGNGKAYAQSLTIGGTLASTTVATVKHHKVVSAETLLYGQYRDQNYDDEPAASAAESGKVIGRKVLTRVNGNHWQVASYNRQGKLVKTTYYQLRQNVSIPTSFAGLSVKKQAEWLTEHSVSVSQSDNNHTKLASSTATSNTGSKGQNLSTTNANSKKQSLTNLPQTGESHSREMTFLGALGLLLSWMLSFVMKRGGENND